MARVFAAALLACGLVAATAMVGADGVPRVVGDVACAVTNAMGRYSLDPGALNQPAYARARDTAELS
jgi:hypothetical protein